MTDRELVSVFWATCAAIVLIWGIAGLVRLGVDRQERAEREITAEEITRALQADLDRITADFHSPTAAETADQPSASDSPRRGGGTSFQEEER